MNFTNFTNSNPDIFFIMYNSYNDLYLELARSSYIYVDDVQNRVKSKEVLLIVIFVIAVVVVIIALLLMLPMIFNVNTVRIKVLYLFIGIPQANVEELVTRCEDFVYKDEEDQQDEDMETVVVDNQLANNGNDDG